MVTNKLCLDDRNNEYIVLCKLGFRVTGVGPPKPPPPLPGPGKQKKPGLNRVKNTLTNRSYLDVDVIMNLEVGFI